MSDLIRREDAIKALYKYNFVTKEVIEREIMFIPSADRTQGEWKPFDLTWGRSVWYCTACEESVEVPCDIWTHKPIYNFCPNCGAKMKGADDE